MDEVIPPSAGWLDERITGIAPPDSVVSDLITVERNRELMTGKVRHGHITGARFLFEESTKQ